MFTGSEHREWQGDLWKKYCRLFFICVHFDKWMMHGSVWKIKFFPKFAKLFFEYHLQRCSKKLYWGNIHVFPLPAEQISPMYYKLLKLVQVCNIDKIIKFEIFEYVNRQNKIKLNFLLFKILKYIIIKSIREILAKFVLPGVEHLCEKIFYNV